MYGSVFKTKTYIKFTPKKFGLKTSVPPKIGRGREDTVQICTFAKIVFQLKKICLFWSLPSQSTTLTEGVASKAVKAKKSVCKWGHKTPT